ncbi:MAG: glycosyltransferase [Magnetococcus sp. THC-1_WYH]
MISAIRNLGLNLDMLFVDDNSPDGTGNLLDQVAVEDPQIHVLHRSGKLGVGSAHLDGIRWSYDNHYEILITMDSDLTHSPEEIPNFLSLADQADVVVGSRFTNPNSLPGWVLWRKAMTHTGHYLTRRLLGLPFDATGAFRLYRLDRIPQGIFTMVQLTGYSFFFESLYRLHLNRMTIKEIPIILPARAYGSSKVRFKDIVVGIRNLSGLAVQARLFPQNHVYRVPITPVVNQPIFVQEDAWDVYWTRQSYRGQWIYDLIARFYRRFIIRPLVNHFLGKFFACDALILHAGCGGGMVDIDMSKHMRIDAMDISSKALSAYARHHVGTCKLIHGSIFSIPCPAHHYDGLFNLGVMEHFQEEQIIPILREFNRVLKLGKCIILFWPPSYGLSVRVLKWVHQILHRFSKVEIQLHPLEHTYIISKEQTVEWLEQSGFSLKVFYFGLRDLFTYQVIVAEKVVHIAE